MGQKTHPYGFRLGIVTDWKSRWYSDKDYTELVNEDWKIRDYLDGELKRGAVSRIELERTRDKVQVDVHTARPGVVIGRKGSEAERLRDGLEKLTGRRIFRMAPLHHHFELKGWAEPTVIVRFWIITVILVLIGLASLKIR